MLGVLMFGMPLCMGTSGTSLAPANSKHAKVYNRHLYLCASNIDEQTDTGLLHKRFAML